MLLATGGKKNRNERRHRILSFLGSGCRYIGRSTLWRGTTGGDSPGASVAKQPSRRNVLLASVNRERLPCCCGTHTRSDAGIVCLPEMQSCTYQVAWPFAAEVLLCRKSEKKGRRKDPGGLYSVPPFQTRIDDSTDGFFQVQSRCR